MNEPTPGAGAPRTVPVAAGGALDPFVGRNVAWWLLEGEPRRWTYARLVDEVEATAGAMMDRGIAPGDYVCMHMEWTGDRVERHKDGWLSFVEREKDMLRVGAENMAAQEVERVVGPVRGRSTLEKVAKNRLQEQAKELLGEGAQQ